ncbi:MAG: hypothetical protein R3240_10820 [Gammaproteobacteria bacterium]|nr:hypothetical protein [Gammaproteobacteria bacterium]
MTCNTWGFASLIVSIALAVVAYMGIGITQEVAWGAAAGMLVAAIVFFIIRRVNPMIEPHEPKHHH